MSEKQVEAVARAICPTLHDNPADWLFWVDEARAVLALPWLAAALRLADIAGIALDSRRGQAPSNAEAYDQWVQDGADMGHELELALAAYRAARRDLEGGA